MTQHTNSYTRRTAIRTGGAALTALAVGGTVASLPVAAQNDPVLMTVDAPPTISSRARGNVTAAIYPDEVGESNPETLDAAFGDDLGFKLGPDETSEFEVEEVLHHADSTRHRLVYNGHHGNYVMGVFFDPSTAGENGWFEQTGPKRAKISAVALDDDDAVDLVAWGTDDVLIR